MWMHYAAEHWPTAQDLKSSIERLREELEDLAFDAQHSAIYEICFCKDSERRHKKIAKTYYAGVALCDTFLNERMSLQKFCRHMIKNDLKGFLADIKKFLPHEYIAKYHLKEEEEE